MAAERGAGTRGRRLDRRDQDVTRLGGDEFDATVSPADGRPADATSSVSPEQAEASELLESLKRPASQMQFTFVDDDEELRRVIEGGDFGAWRVFLHPEQRAYATRTYKGPFRLTEAPAPARPWSCCIELENSRRSRTPVSSSPRSPGLSRACSIETSAVSITSSVAQGSSASPASSRRGSISLRTLSETPQSRAGGSALRSTLSGGTPSVPLPGVERDGWDEAVFDAEPDLPSELRSPAFLESEYLQVVLPNGVTSRADYFAARRPGRGVALDRAKRAQVWSVVEQFRRNARAHRRILWAELSSVAAAYLDAHPEERPQTTSSSMRPRTDAEPLDDAPRARRRARQRPVRRRGLAPTHLRAAGRALASRHQDRGQVATPDPQLPDDEAEPPVRTRRARRRRIHGQRGKPAGRAGLPVRATRTRGADPRTRDAVRAVRRPGATARGLESCVRRCGVDRVLVRTKSATETVVQQLATRNVPATEKSARGKVRVMTMHSAKGLEFSRLSCSTSQKASSRTRWRCSILRPTSGPTPSSASDRCCTSPPAVRATNSSSAGKERHLRSSYSEGHVVVMDESALTRMVTALVPTMSRSLSEQFNVFG